MRTGLLLASTLMMCLPGPVGSLAATPAWPAPIGSCSVTHIAEHGGRLEGDKAGDPNAGSSVRYADGRYQVSYDALPGLDRSAVGDPVRLCVVAFDKSCKKSDGRGYDYAATNQRTGAKWRAADSGHFCSGQ